MKARSESESATPSVKFLLLIAYLARRTFHGLGLGDRDLLDVAGAIVQASAINFVTVIPNPDDENNAIIKSVLFMMPYSPYTSFPRQRATTIPAISEKPFPTILPIKDQEESLSSAELRKRVTMFWNMNSILSLRSPQMTRIMSLRIKRIKRIILLNRLIYCWGEELTGGQGCRAAVQKFTLRPTFCLAVLVIPHA